MVHPSVKAAHFEGRAFEGYIHHQGLLFIVLFQINNGYRLLRN